MLVRGARHNGQGGIDCEIEHPLHGWVPFTAHPADPELFGRELFATLAGGDHGPVAEHVGPTAAELAAAEQAAVRSALAASDAEMARGVEDLIAALKAKGVIADADLPAELRERIVARQAARARLAIIPGTSHG